MAVLLILSQLHSHGDGWDAARILLPEVIDKLSREIRRIVKLPETRKRFDDDALVTMDVDPAALTGILAREVATWGALAKDIGLRVQ